MGCRIIVFRVIVYNAHRETQCEDYDSPVGGPLRRQRAHGSIWGCIVYGMSYGI